MTVLAIGCHPDDIEFLMSGTLLRLKAEGCALHYMNVANGSCGTTSMTVDETVQVRAREAQAAASHLGAEYHKSLVNDMEVLYSVELVRRLAAVVREVEPNIILTQSSQDYMEDHMNTSRLAVGAAFARGMTNFPSVPTAVPTMGDVAIYHAMPIGLTDQVRNPVIPHLFVDVTPVMEQKRAMLACHVSQKQWLDESQGYDSYIDSMGDMTRNVGALSGVYEYAEGWRQHLHIGYSARDDDPLFATIGNYSTYASDLRRKE